MMSRPTAEERASAKSPKPQADQWCGIGIHAVAAASIYVDRATKRRGTPRARPQSNDQDDFATD